MTEVVQRLRQARLVHRHALKHVQRDGAVVQADDDDRHASRRSLAWRTWPARIRSSMSESRTDFQSKSSVDAPPARTRSRASDKSSSRTWYSGPISSPTL